MRMHHLILAAALMLGAPADSAAADVVFTLCPGWPNTVAISKLFYEPYPPSIKKPLTIVAEGTLATTIQPGAKMTVTHSLGSMLIAQSNLDLCAEASRSGMTCPIAPGMHNFRGSFTPPANVPPFVTVNVHVEAYNGDGSKLLCLDTTVKYVP